jgi:hypothetical protein
MMVTISLHAARTHTSRYLVFFTPTSYLGRAPYPVAKNWQPPAPLMLDSGDQLRRHGSISCFFLLLLAYPALAGTAPDGLQHPSLPAAAGDQIAQHLSQLVSCIDSIWSDLIFG